MCIQVWLFSARFLGKTEEKRLIGLTGSCLSQEGLCGPPAEGHGKGPWAAGSFGFDRSMESSRSSAYSPLFG